MAQSSSHDTVPLVNEAHQPMRRLFGYIGRYRARLAFAVTTSIINRILDLMPPILTAWVINTVTDAPPDWIVGLAGDTAGPMTYATLLAILALLVFFGESAFQWMSRYAFLTLAQHAQHDLRMEAYDKLQHREINFFERHRLGETLSMLNDDVNQLERFLNSGFNQLLQLAVLFVFAGSVLFATSWSLALLGLAPVPFIVVASIIYSRLIAPRYMAVRQSAGELLSRLENNMGGILVIKSFTAEALEAKRVGEASAGYRKANHEAIKYSAAYIPIVRMGIALGFAVVLLMGGYRVLTGALTAGSLVMFAMMIQRMLWPLTNISQVYDDYERARASARRTFGLLQTPPRIQDPDQPKELGDVAGRVAFEDVHFSYGRGEPVMRGVSFDIEPGMSVGIAGPTGAGKSTLVKLLLRLYDPDQGVIRVDGIDLRDLAQVDLRRHIALVSQDVYLFHGTIRENIAYREGETPLDLVTAAAEMAQFHDFVQTLPDGYDTIVGERGIRLSGGQRQRLSIARAVLKDAPIMVFDEATSSVDTETERAIQHALREVTRDRTAIIIAHRLSTIRHADRILVLRDGQVAEAGSHDDLLEAGGVYADLWHVQAGDREAIDVPSDGSGNGQGQGQGRNRRFTT